MIDPDDRPTDHPPEQRELISRRAYAKRRGWVPSTVVELCQAGKIPLFIDCPGCGSTRNIVDQACECGQAIAGHVDTRKAKIDPAIADRTLQAARDPARAYVAERHAAARDGEGEGALKLEAPAAEPTGYALYREQEARLRVEHAEMDLARKRGELGVLADMSREATTIARQVRDSLTNIPDRLAPVLAAERDEAQVHHLLLKEITAALDELHRKLGGGSTDTLR